MTSLRGAAVALAVTLAGCAVTGSGSERLSVSGPSWALGGSDVTVRVTTSGALATYDAMVVAAVGNKVVGRFSTERGEVRFVLPAKAFVVGENTIAVKTGSERSELVVRVVPRAYLAWPAVIVAVSVGLAAVLRRRGRLTAAGR